ncbi:FecR family protein [Hymenobacter sp. GOD-10R]|uniref:FecR family protein n=1 Tax=Hymenobacter sp. GOD-10R TaxID=3093922 RepID=UPI002D78D097|nr:FecR domain-containing protein [Hymenobacter sp. GOD-10R]WRQ31891.1 FecR domain-containing protein [Hymenobacter sp. GOD-10R]
MDYDDYTTEEFAADESFQAYSLGTDATAREFWLKWQQQHPAKTAELNEASELVRLVAGQRRRVVPMAVQQQELAKLLHAINQPPAPRPWRLRLRHIRVMAATLCLVLLAGVGSWLLQGPTKPSQLARYTTPFGQQRRITLPDGSVVVLNGNSTLETAARWPQAGRREVWLTGEAYFEVNHLAPKSVRNVASAASRLQFQVHAGDVDVTVLGTKFNVNSRGEHTQVVLNSGKVQLDRHAAFHTEHVLLKPGELAEYSAPARSLATKTVNASAYSSWTHGYLTFDHTPLADIIPLIQQTYGLNLTVTDKNMLRQQVTGSVPNDNAEVLLSALSKALNVKVSRTGNQVQLLPL